MSARTRIGPAEDTPQGPVSYAVGAGIAAGTEKREPRFEEG